MTNSNLRFDGRVVIVTGAGRGLGREYALMFGSRGASVVVNDLGVSLLGSDQDASPADQVVNEIIAAGGKAVASYDSVVEGEKIVAVAMKAFGRVDVIVNNAGNLRDRTFAKMTEAEWEAVYQVHLKGSFKLSKAAWPIMRAQKYGRIIMTSSTSGVYGNFGQSNYGAAKHGLVGLAYTLSQEGAKYNIHVNALVPTALSRMTAPTMSQERVNDYDPKYVAPTVGYLCHESSNVTGKVVESAGGFMAVTRWELSSGALFNSNDTLTPAAVKHRWNEITNFDKNAIYPDDKVKVSYLQLLEKSKSNAPNPQGPELRYDGQVAIVTGSGGGLGREYALMLARYGAKVVVNDVGTNKNGQKNADLVVAEIRNSGGQAVANYDSVENGERVVQTAIQTYGRIDILINNAGILRDKSFIKMTEKEWDDVYRIHLYGTFKVTHAAWPHFMKQKSGAIINTSSTVGLYGNFGQANYSSAKAAMLGLTNVLALEGARNGIRVNSLAPNAGTAMTATVMPPAMVEALKPAYVAPFVCYLVHKSCTDSGKVFQVGSCWAGQARRQRATGYAFPHDSTLSIEGVRDNWATISNFDDGKAHFVPTNHAAAAEGFEKIKKAAKNFLVDVQAARDHKFPSVEFTYTARDAMLYAVGIGASRKDLPLVYELSPKFQTFPTYAVIPSFFVKARIGQFLPPYHPMMLLHGEQSVVIHEPLPTAATLILTPQVVDIQDKVKGAAVTLKINLVCKKTGKLLAESESTSFIRGIGGFSKNPKYKQPAPAARNPLSVYAAETPSSPPNATIAQKISPDQAALYRLSGDYNPLHIDPEMAAKGNFKEPILHGLCSMGFASRHVVNGMAAGDASKLKAIKVRFSSPVYPGETIQTSMWTDKSNPNRVLFNAKVVERNITVISNAIAEFSSPVSPSLNLKSNI
ncbi:hypothetical protein BB559_000840 [Furculomyces boomerangus]|uniref:Ketoreductase domain-containing protein n=1 Tax=Furculomyces boomerangus TaxID=61424 RepID=A0A2T9Z3V8_9FUNG|nr:hypothetical protein BB559_000840 [Furculomyces boomerangus]